MTTLLRPDRVRSALTRSGYSLRDLAAALGITPAALASRLRVDRGYRWHAADVRLMVELTGAPAAWLAAAPCPAACPCPWRFLCAPAVAA